MSEPLTTLRLPMDYEVGRDGRNRGRAHLDVHVVLDASMERRGEVRGLGQPYSATNGFSDPVFIALSEWDEQVLLHEVLHVLGLPGATEHDPYNHRTINRIEVALWETGWRKMPALDVTP
jgi:hypothetical protein